MNLVRPSWKLPERVGAGGVEVLDLADDNDGLLGGRPLERDVDGGSGAAGAGAGDEALLAHLLLLLLLRPVLLVLELGRGGGAGHQGTHGKDLQGRA